MLDALTDRTNRIHIQTGLFRAGKSLTAQLQKYTLVFWFHASNSFPTFSFQMILRPNAALLSDAQISCFYFTLFFTKCKAISGKKSKKEHDTRHAPIFVSDFRQKDLLDHACNFFCKVVCLLLDALAALETNEFSDCDRGASCLATCS